MEFRPIELPRVKDVAGEAERAYQLFYRLTSEFVTQLRSTSWEDFRSFASNTETVNILSAPLLLCLWGVLTLFSKSPRRCGVSYPFYLALVFAWSTVVFQFLSGYTLFRAWMVDETIFDGKESVIYSSLLVLAFWAMITCTGSIGFSLSRSTFMIIAAFIAFEWATIRLESEHFAGRYFLKTLTTNRYASLMSSGILLMILSGASQMPEPVEEVDEEEEKKKKAVEDNGIEFPKIGEGTLNGMLLYWHHRKVISKLLFPYSLKLYLVFSFNILLMGTLRWLRFQTPYLCDKVVDAVMKLNVGTDRNIEPILKILITYTVFSFLGGHGALGGIERVVGREVTHIQDMEVQKTLLNHSFTQSWDFFISKKQGELAGTINSARHHLGKGYDTVLYVVPAMVDLVVSIHYVFANFDPVFRLFLLVSFLIYSSVVWVDFVSLFTEMERDTTAQMKIDTTRREILGYWEPVLLFNRQKEEIQKYRELSDSHAWSSSTRSIKDVGFDMMRTLTIGFSRLLVTAVTTVLIARGQGKMSNFIFMLNRWDSSFSELGSVIWRLRAFSSSVPRFKRVIELVESRPSVVEASKPVSIEIKGDIEFKNVSFFYNATEKTTGLRDISFKARAGQTIALVGQTGSGKSTLSRLILRQYDPTEGQVLLDGHNLKDISLDCLRKQIGTVPQTSALFPRTIRENVVYGKQDATTEELHEACKMADIHEFAMSQPKGYETQVGERGIKLSGGECQRVAIARLLLTDCRIAILDEATSAVDVKTEEKIQKALDRVQDGRRTTFLIAHRLSTIRNADLIIVLEKGRILEQGSFSELLSRDGPFAELWRIQISESNKMKEVGRFDSAMPSPMLPS